MTADRSSRCIAIVGSNSIRLWGLTGETRIARIARAAGFAIAGPDEDATLVADARFAFDPLWLRHIAKTPGTVLTLEGAPVLGHARDGEEARTLAAGRVPPGLTELAAEAGEMIENEQLRKRETPFVAPLTPATVRSLERASYFGAYKGVTDLLTKYLWPEWALVLTRVAARIGMTPNQVTGIGALLCVAATIAFWFGHYWLGMAVGLGFMVLDTVDGKLARCTITSSKWGNVFDHGIDLVHPPFWWVAWARGLGPYGRPLEADALWWTLAVILGGYVVQRVIEGAFMRLYGMHVHVWRRFDSRFRLVTARRNPNMVILFFATLAGRPDLGLVAVAWWTAISLVVHAVQLVQAMLVRARGGMIRSWIA